MPDFIVQWLGDPEYGGADDFEPSRGHMLITASGAADAAQAAVELWRTDQPEHYGPGTVVGVQEVVDPPPVWRYTLQGDGWVRWIDDRTSRAREDDLT